MLRYRSPWLLTWVLVGVALSNSGHARNPPDEGELILELLERVEQLEAEVRHIRGELEIQHHQIELLRQDQVLADRSVSPPRATPNMPVVPPPPEHPVGVHAPSAPVQQPPVAPAPPTVVERTARTDRPEIQPSATPAPPPTIERPPPASSAPTPPAGSEQTEFDAALGELREGRYREAITRFQQFLGTYPTSKLAGDAQYWLGESYYVSQDYNAAREAFINLGLHYPQNTRLPDALLKLGYLYGELGDEVRAREVLEKLVGVYPNTQAARLAEQQLQSWR